MERFKTKIWLILIIVFVIGAFVRGIDAFRPIGKSSWRECDVAAIARNYVREGMNPFYPRIDWRGNSEGFAEMEFPFQPYSIALLYQVFGEHEFLGRILSFLFSLITLWYFYRFSKNYLDEIGVLAAFAFFSFNPLFVGLSTALQPEVFMFGFSLIALFYYVKWLENEGDKHYFLAILFTTLAILSKLTAVHIGFLFLFLAFQKYRWETFGKIKIWLFGLLSLAPAMLWYAHAKNLWLTYGNSLGVSNEAHFAGWDLFTNSRFLLGIINSEVFAVWLFSGLFIGIFAISFGWQKRLTKLCLVWLIASFIFYLVAARTTSSEWATYYHIFSLSPVALLVGIGAEKCFVIFRRQERTWKTVFAGLVFFALIGTFVFQARKIRANFLQERVADAGLASAKLFAPLMKKPGLILASGGNCFDEDGFRVAYNESYMFYWLERKGFNVCVEEQSAENVRNFAELGAVYFVAEKNKLVQKPNFEPELKNNFPLVAETDAMLLFDLSETHDK